MGGIFKSKSNAVDTEAIEKEAENKERQKTIEKQRRGLEGTVKTSYQGILQASQDIKRKKLLGE